MINDIRAYWDARPCNIRHSDLPVGTREYFDAVEKRKYLVENHIPGFAEFAKWEGKRVLEIGCGLGTDAVNFARAGADYTGVDLSSVSIDLAKQRFQVFKLKGKFLCCDAERLVDHLPVGRYDLIYSFGVLHHSMNPTAAVRALLPYLGFDSELRCMVYARNSWKAWLVEAGLAQWEAQAGCPQVVTYTEADLPDLLGNLRIFDVRQTHLFPYQVAKYVQHEYEFEPWFKAMPKAMFDMLEKKLGCHLLVKCGK